MRSSFSPTSIPRSFSPLAATKKLTTVYRPYPVVGVITPWNFPFLMPGVGRGAPRWLPAPRCC